MLAALHVCVLALIADLAIGSKPKPILYVHNGNEELLAEMKEKGIHDNLLLSFKESVHGDASSDFLKGIDIKGGAKRLSSHFINLANTEMGVKELQAVYDELPEPEPEPEPAAADIQEVKRLASHIQAKLHRYVGALWRTRGVIEDLFWKHLHDPMATVTPCCSLDDRQLTYSLKFGSPVNKNATCDVAPNLIKPFAFNPGRKATSAFVSNLQNHPSIKWQYFISKDGIHSEYPAHKFASEHDCSGFDDTRHQQVYLSTVYPAAKHVVLLLDVGGRPSGHQLKVARAAAARLLAALRHTDRVSVLAVSDQVQRPAARACLRHGLSSATGEAKFFLANFIDSCRVSAAPTNHTLGLEAAFELLTRVPELRRRSGQALVVYISRGVLSSLFDPQQVMNVMARYQQNINASVVVNAFGIASGSQSSLERDFLDHITRQDFSRYNISINKRLVRGQLFVINSTDQLSFQVGKMFGVFNRTTGRRATFSLPYWDTVSKDLVVSVTQSCYHVDYFIGILGMDLHLPDLVEDLTYFSQIGGRYAFIIDDHGYTLMHPSFSRPLVEPRHPFHSDISSVEHRPGFVDVRRRILSSSSGSEVLRYRVWDERGFNVTVRVLYTWQRVQDFPYTVCIAYPDERRERPPRAPTSPPPDLVYHRIDLSRSRKLKLCRQFRHMATMSSASLFLSATAFLSPYDHLTGLEPSYQLVQGYMAYLSDVTRLIANPGLKRTVRDDVALTSRVTAHWRRRLMAAGTSSRYIVRTFVATSSGVVVAYPGLPLDTWYEPTRRSWYRRALEHPGRVVLSSPYLDGGGAGYIVTLSQTIRANNRSDSVAAVMGMDMTIGYFYQLLVSVLGNQCQTPEVTCFLLDDRGYMTSHPEHVSPWRDGPVEQQHVFSKEQLLANHMLSQKEFVSKMRCNRYTDYTVQRYYQFNTSMRGVVTNVGSGDEYCQQYQIVAIPGTNVFLGVVNQTCDKPAFCPCSRYDRSCLNCERMEPEECECPCECPLRTDLCTEEVLDRHATCPVVPETVYGPRVDRDVSRLDECVPIDCQARHSSSDCIGVLGCEWCQLEADGQTPLTRPFCTYMERCFRGVLGAASPYGDHGNGLSESERLRATSSPVGPVAGGIIAAFVSLALAVLCYRHHVTGRYRQAVPLALEEEDDELAELELEPPPPAAVNRLVLPPLAPAAVSPYRLNPGYRRPAPGTDSDHGYSTMTPHDDSEAAGEPERVRAASPASSVLSSPASPAPAAPPPAQPLTVLQPHQIRAEAQVHAVDAC